LKHFAHRLKKLEEKRAPPDLISVIYNTSEAAAEKQRREFLEKHGRPPTREIVIQFV
jgi:hypothetical protein